MAKMGLGTWIFRSMIEEPLSLSLLANFPNLLASNHTVTSPYDRNYNCIAYAASVSNQWWWPVKAPGVYWPLPDFMEETVECFIAAYESIGFSVCESGTLDSGVEKIAIYADALGKPTHAARQLGDGSWTSKLGRSQDIRHSDPGALYGKAGYGLGYGEVSVFMGRALHKS